MQITTYERCETMATGLPEDHLVGLTKPSVDRILKMDSPGDCLALYTFYCYTRKWQKNSAVYATSEFAMKALGWGRDKFSNAKRQLKEQGFIEDVKRLDEQNRVVGWYVGVRYAQTATLMNSHTTENPDCGNSSPKYLGMVNEIPSNGKEIQANGSESSGVPSHSQSTPDLFPPNQPTADAKASIATAQPNDPPTTLKRIQGAVRQKSPPRKPRQPKLADDAFIAQLAANNPRIDMDTELRKMNNWLLSHPNRQKTRAFVTNWINRVVDKLPEKEERFADF